MPASRDPVRAMALVVVDYHFDRPAEIQPAGPGAVARQVRELAFASPCRLRARDRVQVLPGLSKPKADRGDVFVVTPRPAACFCKVAR